MTAKNYSHEEIAAHLSEDTLREIEDIDASIFGFGREECCGPVPSKLPGSMTLNEHIFLSTDLSAVQWDPKTENVPGYSALEKSLKTIEGTKLTVYHQPGPDTCVLRFKYSEVLSSMIITQYSCITEGDLPWESNTSVSCDRSNDVFIFICSHRSRDKRCGYCGAVLVDLLRQSLKNRNCLNPFIHVYPCSHVGGHIYAGNVLVYTKEGGVCFGCVTPADVDVLIDSLVDGRVNIPASLEPRIRGRIGYTSVGSICNIM